MISRVYSHSRRALPVAVRHRVPAEAVGKDRVWYLDGVHGGVAFYSGEVDEGIAEITCYGTWLPNRRTEAQLKPAWDVDSPQWQGLQFGNTGQVFADKLQVMTQKVQTKIPEDAELVYTDGKTLQVFRLEAFRNGRKIWAEFFHTTMSNVVRFAGKVEASDPLKPETLLAVEETVSIWFPEGASVLFAESLDDELHYVRVPIADGAAFPFSGYLTFGPESERAEGMLPNPTGMVDGVMLNDNHVPMLDGHIPPGLLIAPVQHVGEQWNSDLLTVSMEQYPVGQRLYSRETGDHEAFGWPGAEASIDPELIQPLQRGAAVESFRPIQRLEIDGSPFRGQRHVDQGFRYATHNMTPTSRAGSSGYYHGKGGAVGSGVPRGWWDLQDGEHDSFHCVVRDFWLTGNPISRDTLERSGELLSWGWPFNRIPRHLGRTTTHLIEAAMSPIDVGVATQCADYVKGSIKQACDWMEDPNTCHEAAARDKALPYMFDDGYRNDLPGENGAAVFQEGVVTSLLATSEAFQERWGAFDPRFEVYFTSAVEWLIAEGFYENQFGHWSAWWVVGAGGGHAPASSHRLIILQCSASLAWYFKKYRDSASEPRQALAERAQAILQSVWGGDSDCSRYLACWISRADLFS